MIVRTFKPLHRRADFLKHEGGNAALLGVENFFDKLPVDISPKPEYDMAGEFQGDLDLGAGGGSTDCELKFFDFEFKGGAVAARCPVNARPSSSRCFGFKHSDLISSRYARHGSSSVSVQQARSCARSIASPLAGKLRRFNASRCRAISRVHGSFASPSRNASTGRIILFRQGAPASGLMTVQPPRSRMALRTPCPVGDWRVRSTCTQQHSCIHASIINAVCRVICVTREAS